MRLNIPYRSRRTLPICRLSAVLILAVPAQAAVRKIETFEFQGAVHEDKDLSAVTRVGSLLVIGSDEGASLQTMMPDPSAHTLYHANDELIDLLSGDVEIDIEGLAYDDGWVYAAGSHSLKRKRLKPDEETVAWNRRRILQLEFEDSRNGIFRVKIDPATGRAASGVVRVNLLPILQRDPVLGRFCSIPGKENGVDIEGIAVKDGRVAIGFRSPVLRDNYVPVLMFPFETPLKYELRFINLDGHGIRDLAAVSGGYLLLSGPPGDVVEPGRLYFWDGRDAIPGIDQSIKQPTLLGEIPLGDMDKPEGLAILEEYPSAYDVLIVSDGKKKGAPTRYLIER